MYVCLNGYLVLWFDGRFKRSMLVVVHYLVHSCDCLANNELTVCSGKQW